MVLRALKDDVASLLLTDQDRAAHKTKKSMLARLLATRWQCGSAGNDELAWLETRALLDDKRNAMLVRQWTRLSVNNAESRCCTADGRIDSFANRYLEALNDYFGQGFVYLFTMRQGDVAWCRISVGHRPYLSDLIALRSTAFVGVSLRRNDVVVVTSRSYLRRYLIGALTIALDARGGIVEQSELCSEVPFDLLAMEQDTEQPPLLAEEVAHHPQQQRTVSLADGIQVSLSGRHIDKGLLQLTQHQHSI